MFREAWKSETPSGGYYHYCHIRRDFRRDFDVISKFPSGLLCIVCQGGGCTYQGKKEFGYGESQFGFSLKNDLHLLFANYDNLWEKRSPFFHLFCKGFLYS